MLVYILLISLKGFNLTRTEESITTKSDHSASYVEVKIDNTDPPPYEEAMKDAQNTTEERTQDEDQDTISSACRIYLRMFLFLMNIVNLVIFFYGIYFLHLSVFFDLRFIPRSLFYMILAFLIRILVNQIDNALK